MNRNANVGTGSGKTLISVLLLQHVMRQELIDRGMGKPHRVAFFLVSGDVYCSSSGGHFCSLLAG